MFNYMVQGIGVIGLFFAIISFQRNNNKSILGYQIMASMAFMIHFILLGAYTRAAMNLLGAGRNYVFYHREKLWACKKLWLYIFISLYIMVGLLTWNSNYSILPTIAMILSSVGLWIENSTYTRLIVFPSSPCWLIYNFHTASVAGMLTETFILLSLIIGIVRFDICKSIKKIK